jgi:O-antigen/teichoic acid export membrane protein
MLKFRESVEPLVKTAFILLITPGIVVAIGCWFYSNELMKLLYGEKHLEQAVIIFPILMSCFVAYSTQYIFGSLLTAHGNLRELNLIAASVILINVTMNLFLIPRFEATGSAVSSFTAQFLNALIQIIIAQSVFKFRINYKLILTLIVFIMGVIIINYFSKGFHHNWMVNFAIMVIGCGIWAFVTGLLNIKSMVRILKYG